MNLDRDLRDALRPLRGDAVEDARAVLARLDGSSGPGAPRGPFGLPIAVVVLAVLALGVVVGVAVGRAFGGDGGRSEVVEPPPPGPATPPDDSPKEPPPKDPPPKDPRPKELPPMDEQGILLMAFGKVSIEEPKKPTETVAPGGWRVPMGTLFETGESLAGLYVYDSRAAIRLGKQTVAAVERDRIALRGGRLWLSTLGEPVAQRIETEAVVVLSHGAELVVDHAADGVAVIVLDGGATVRAAGGDARHLASMQRCTIDRTGMIGEVKPVPFAGEYVGWMAPMILQQQDDRELYSWLDELVAAYVEGSYRDAAATVLRRFEARAVPRLFEVLDRFVDDPATLHRTAALIADLAQFPQREWLFAMLERGDEETRASAYRALVRVGGRKSAVRDEAFWRAAPASEREAESARWRELLR